MMILLCTRLSFNLYRGLLPVISSVQLAIEHLHMHVHVFTLRCQISLLEANFVAIN